MILKDNIESTNLFTKINKASVQKKLLDIRFLAVLFALTLLVRYGLLEFQSGDYQNYLSHWYDFILANGRFKAFKYGFSDYNPPYLYLLSLSTLLPFAKIYSIKFISIIFDFILAIFAYKIIKEKYNNNLIAWGSLFAILFAPTVILNSSFWGQCDAIFTSFMALCIYFLIRKNNNSAAIAFGLAISFKLQAAFFLPVLFVMYLKKNIKFKSFLYIPIIFIASLVPAFIAGRPFIDLLKIYIAQADSQHELTFNAPNIYQWIPGADFNYFNFAGSISAVFILLALCFMAYNSKKEITRELIVKLSLLSVLLVPYFLPKMHERYFFPADTISIIYAFYNPKKFYIPIAINLISLFSYAPFLFGETLVPLAYLAIALGIVILIVFTDLIDGLYPIQNKQNSEPSALSDSFGL